MKKMLVSVLALAAVLPAAPVLADPPPWAPAHGRRAHDRAVYDAQGYYVEPRRLSRDDAVWRGNDGRYHCRRDNGTTGLIIGAAAGALLGRELAGSGDRTIGMLLGGAGGALLGQAIDRGELRCR